MIIDIDNPEILYDYLFFAMQMIDFKLITTGNAQPLITAGKLKTCEIGLPPIEVQHKISSLLSSYDELLDTIQAEKQAVEKIKAQLMNDIFE